MATRIESFPRPIPTPGPELPPPRPAAPLANGGASPPEQAPTERLSADPALLRFVRDARAAERSGRLAQAGGIARSEASIDEERTARLRSFFASYSVRVEGPNGPIDVVTPFGMNHGGDEVQRKASQLRDALGGDVRGLRIGLLCAGRPSPHDVQKVATRLAALHPEEASDPVKFQALLRETGVGIDCAGVVQQALYASRGWQVPFEHGAFGLRPRLDEALGNLRARGFARVEDPAEARPGDIIALAPPRGDAWGHRVIVVEKHAEDATAERAERFTNAGCEVSTGDRLIELRVASSWGGREVAERSFFYDERTGKWADDVGGEIAPSNDDGPYNHPMEGIFRAP